MMPIRQRPVVGEVVPKIEGAVSSVAIAGFGEAENGNL